MNIVKLVFKNTCFKQTCLPGLPEAAADRFPGAETSLSPPPSSSAESDRNRRMDALSQAEAPFFPSLPAPSLARQGTCGMKNRLEGRNSAQRDAVSASWRRQCEITPKRVFS